MEFFSSIAQTINDTLWGIPMVVLLLGTHIFLTIRLKFPQRKIFTAIKLSVKSDSGAKGDVSQFGALVTSLAATIGTGNIIGVATAIALGGPGAVFWCWLTGVLGIATKYSEALLAVKYRVKQPNGKMLGGPMYAIERGLGQKWLAVLFCIFTIIASFGIGNLVQTNAISTTCYETYHIPQYLSGLIVATALLLVTIFGIKGISKVCSALIPIMAGCYVAGCLYILFVNGAYVWPAIKLIVTAAFNPEAAGGGFVGGSIIVAARYGISRGLFSNESGLGSAPIVAAAARTNNPVRQALVSSTGTFWDTVVICAITGIVLVSSILAHPDITVDAGPALTRAAFDKIPVLGRPILTFGLITFAFSTILGWGYYGDRAMEYLGGRKWRIGYHCIFVVCAFVGALVQLSLVWNIADIANALMAMPNIISLILLSGVIAAETKKYLWNGNIQAPSTPDKDEQ